MALDLNVVLRAVEDVQRPGDPAQSIRVAIEPTLGPGQLQHQASVGQWIVTYEASGRTVGAHRSQVFRTLIAGVSERLVHLGHLLRRELWKPARRGQGSLEELRRLDVGVNGPGPLGGDK